VLECLVVDHGSTTDVPVGVVTKIDQKPRPYRWGYFQGVILIPFSLLVLLGAASNRLEAHPDPWYLATVETLIGIIGLPLSVGILRKKKYALNLVYVMFGLSLLLGAIKIPVAIRNFASQETIGSAFFEAELLLFWLLSMVYYRKRQEQFS
jgi:hypothetical protein